MRNLDNKVKRFQIQDLKAGRNVEDAENIGCATAKITV